jgi:uncharacterized protein (TIGR02145 family)
MKHLLGLAMIFAIVISGCKKSDVASIPVLTTNTVGSITANTAQAGGNITSTGGSAITKRGSCWATHGSPSVADSFSNDGAASGTFTSNLINLYSNTTYYVSAYAINATGTAYGNAQTFTTAKGVPAVTTTTITNIAPLTANSGGNVISDGGAAITARGICWSTSIHPTTANFRTVDSTNGTGALNDTLTFLASQTTYYIRAYATNSFGTGYGAELSFVSSSANTVADVEGNVYPYITIGTQIWMGSNLRTGHYRNGDPITNGFNTNFDWFANTLTTSSLIGAYTFPNADSANNLIFGKLYNSAAVNDSRGMCPLQWHVASEGDFDALELSQGVDPADTGSNPAGVNLPALTALQSKLLVGGSSGLNFQKSGQLSFLIEGQTNYNAFGQNADYWTSWSFVEAPSIFNNYLPIDMGNPYSVLNPSIDHAYSVRCVKD